MAASSHVRGGMLHGERRRLHRQPSLTVRPVELAHRRRIRGYRGRDWALLPCTELQGRDCVQLSVGSSWLQHCLGVRRQRGSWRGVVRSLMVDCLHAFESCRESGQCDATGEHSKASQPPPGRKRVLDSDDEAELPPKGVEPRGGGREEDKKPWLSAIQGSSIKARRIRLSDGSPHAVDVHRWGRAQVVCACGWTVVTSDHRAHRQFVPPRWRGVRGARFCSTVGQV